MNTTASTALWEIRKAVKPWLEDTSETILFGCSGGADSMAMALALFIEANGVKVIPVVVDHGLQNGSAEITAQTVAKHTLNDQAENVLLGLARGSGARSLAGMAIENNVFVRPMLKIDRQTTVTACQESGIEIWSDPHNEDLRFTRVRVRKNVLPTLEENLGPGITQALVRSADLLRDDADALDGFANEFFAQIDWMNIEVKDLERLPKAIRSRVLRLAIYKAGSPAGSLSAEHIASAGALISDWHGQKEVALPGNVKLWRNSGTISLSNQ